jgi:hypothetical protein
MVKTNAANLARRGSSSVSRITGSTKIWGTPSRSSWTLKVVMRHQKSVCSRSSSGDPSSQRWRISGICPK